MSKVATMKKSNTKEKVERVKIPALGEEEKGEAFNVTPPRMRVVKFLITGTAPLVINKFSNKAKELIRTAHKEGSASKSKKKREPKDFEAAYQGALRVSRDGWYGIHAGAFRNAMISACRLVGYQMTKAKLTAFINADGFDADDAAPLVKIINGEPHQFESMVRLPNGSPDVRVRAMFDPGWQAIVSVRFDEDQFTANDMVNLMARVGMQVGVGEGRPDSRTSTGMGWGLFDITE